MTTRAYSAADRLIIELDEALRTVFGRPPPTGRPDPAEGLDEPELSASERRLAARLMRVNHSGEVAAQALYRGQALAARRPEVAEKLERSAAEENDHLLWCERRIEALGGRKSLLNPFWYAGSFGIGALAGAAGDAWSLGFVAETERQVVRHLERHLARLPEEDTKSRAILERMREDEGRHATKAIESGARELPAPARRLMTVASKVMTETAFWI